MTEIREAVDELTRSVKDMRRSQLELNKKVDCIVESIHTFQETWEGTLKVAKDNQIQNAQLKQALIEKGLVGSVWAVMAFLAYASWEYVRAHLK